jgi:hypothetical protein
MQKATNSKEYPRKIEQGVAEKVQRCTGKKDSDECTFKK